MKSIVKMSKKFPQYKGLNLPKVAEEILAFWEENQIFDKSVTSREGQEPFVFFEVTTICKWLTWHSPRDGALNQGYFLSL